jgi:hypothetical protein
VSGVHTRKGTFKCDNEACELILLVDGTWYKIFQSNRFSINVKVKYYH